MEKNTPHYNLIVIKGDVMRLGRAAFTRSAQRGGKDLGLSFKEVQEVVFGLHVSMLFKSMTTYDDHRVWQDVYHTRSHGREIYIKVTYRLDGGPPVISFKEKDS